MLKGVLWRNTRSEVVEEDTLKERLHLVWVLKDDQVYNSVIDWMCVFPQNLYFGTLIFNILVGGDGALWIKLGIGEVKIVELP